MGALRHFRAGESILNASAARKVIHSARFGVDVLPGHPSMSIFEDLLSDALGWHERRRAAGARKSMWLRTLRDEYAEDYDLIVVDVSPSLDAINRSALLGSHTFVTPMAPDLFSPYALDNITAWLRRWLGEYNHGRGRARSTGMAANLPMATYFEKGWARAEWKNSALVSPVVERAARDPSTLPSASGSPKPSAARMNPERSQPSSSQTIGSAIGPAMRTPLVRRPRRTRSLRAVAEGAVLDVSESTGSFGCLPRITAGSGQPATRTLG
jgi:hypothetical protein